jgi:hypothetical protein
MVTEENLRARALNGLIYELADDNIGIYPQAVSGGPNAYEKRSERQEGWNDCATAQCENREKIEAWFEALPSEHKALIEDLLLTERLSLLVKSDVIFLYVNCSDTFYWGCSDLERIEFDDLPSLMECYSLSRRGGELWCARKRKMRPQTASYEECYPPSEWYLFDAAGPERSDPDGASRPDLSRARKAG